MGNVQQEIISVLLLTLREKELLSEDVYGSAKEAIAQKKEWPDWFCISGT